MLKIYGLLLLICAVACRQISYPNLYKDPGYDHSGSMDAADPGIDSSIDSRDSGSSAVSVVTPNNKTALTTKYMDRTITQDQKTTRSKLHPSHDDSAEEDDDSISIESYVPSAADREQSDATTISSVFGLFASVIKYQAEIIIKVLKKIIQMINEYKSKNSPNGGLASGSISKYLFDGLSSLFSKVIQQSIFGGKPIIKEIIKQ